MPDPLTLRNALRGKDMAVVYPLVQTIGNRLHGYIASSYLHENSTFQNAHSLMFYV